MAKENKGLGASVASATDRVGGLRPEPTASSQPSGRSPHGATDDLRARFDDASATYGRGMAGYEAGRISAHELKTLKGRMTRAETALRQAHYAEVYRG